MWSVLVAAALAQVPCESRETRWAPSPLVYLRLADGSPWGWVERSECVGVEEPSARARFEPDGGTMLEVSHAGVSLEAWVRELTVYSRAALSFGGFTSSRATQLVAQASGDGGIAVRPARRDDLLALRAWVPTTVACESLSLSGEAVASLTKPALEREVRLTDPRGVDTFVVAAKAQVESTRGREVVLRLADGATVVGTTKEVLTPGPEMTSSFSIGPSAICCEASDELFARALRGQPHTRECWFDLSLWVAHRARRERVGVMQKGVFFDVVSTDGDWVTISLREGFFALSRDWTLVVRATDLEACSRNEPERGAHLETFPR